MVNNSNIPPEWQNLMRLIERLGFGEVKISVQNGKPVRVEIAVKSIKLDAPPKVESDDIDDDILSFGNA
jgi:hypothetical protein